MAASSIESVQNHLDSFMLAVFEAARGHGVANEENCALEDCAATRAAEVKTQFEILSNLIDNLMGIDKTAQQLEDEIKESAAAYHCARDRVLGLEQKLHDLMKDVDHTLDLVQYPLTFYYLSLI